MKKSIAVLAGISGMLGAGLFLTAPGRLKKEEDFAPFQFRNVAHRGLFEADQSIPENSMAAFARAADAGYGIELDLQLSKDGRVVVFHDDDLNRMCGVDSPLSGLTWKQLQQLRLADTEERIPLFTEVLDLVDGRVPMIVELKAGKTNALLCGKTRAILECYPGEFCVESFDPTIVRWFKKHMPEVVRGQLSCLCDGYKSSLPLVTKFVLSRCLLNFLARPQFIAYKVGPQPLSVRLAEKLGAKKVCWTSHDPVNEKFYDTVIFEHYRPELWFD